MFLYFKIKSNLKKNIGGISCGFNLEYQTPSGQRWSITSWQALKWANYIDTVYTDLQFSFVLLPASMRSLELKESVVGCEGVGDILAAKPELQNCPRREDSSVWWGQARETSWGWAWGKRELNWWLWGSSSAKLWGRAIARLLSTSTATCSPYSGSWLSAQPAQLPFSSVPCWPLQPLCGGSAIWNELWGDHLISGWGKWGNHLAGAEEWGEGTALC